MVKTPEDTAFEVAARAGDDRARAGRGLARSEEQTAADAAADARSGDSSPGRRRTGDDMRPRSTTRSQPKLPPADEAAETTAFRELGQLPSEPAADSRRHRGGSTPARSRPRLRIRRRRRRGSGPKHRCLGRTRRRAGASARRHASAAACRLSPPASSAASSRWPAPAALQFAGILASPGRATAQPATAKRCGASRPRSPR